MFHVVCQEIRQITTVIINKRCLCFNIICKFSDESVSQTKKYYGREEKRS